MQGGDKRTPLVLGIYALISRNIHDSATSRLLVTLRHIHIMSANKRTGAPRWKEQLDAALENEEKGDTNCTLNTMTLHTNRTWQLFIHCLPLRLQKPAHRSLARALSCTGHSCRL